MVRCPSCGEENPAGNRFCGECGTPLAAAAAPRREVRKTVTVLFCDVAGSTALGERLDPESLRALMTRYFEDIKRLIEGHGGTVEKFIGDAVMAVFGIPTLHEDDALRAVRAAVDIRASLQGLNEELAERRGLTVTFRTGITTGEVVAGDPSAGQTLVTGDTVNTAARLEQAAQPGDILLGEPTYRLVRDAVTVEVVEPISAKGKSEPLAAYRLIAVSASAAGHARRTGTPLVGRERELDRLRGVWTAVLAERSCQLFTLLGTAGVGKSRLVAEFTASLGDQATVLKGRCLAYGEGITYWPLREIVHAAAGIDEADGPDEARTKLAALLVGERDAELLTARVASAIGLSVEQAAQEEIFWATRKLLEHLARERPLVVLVEDIHWAEPSLLDLLEHIADLARDAPILLLCPARPELLDSRAGWGGGKLNATVVLLEPLAGEATGRLIEALPGGSALPAMLRRRILAAAEGNPLYLEEMLGMLIDEGLVVERDGEWQAAGDLARVSVPPTVRALLAARLEQLSPTERAIAERASIVGRIFEQAAVTELAPEALRPEVARGLLALVRKELVRPERSELAAGDAFKFRHLLIRDAAYEALPKSERAELHERFADWLERVAGERLTEYEEIVGHHLEQAHRYRTELGESGERVDRLAVRAGELLARSGERALDRSDLAAAVDLLARAIALLPRDRSWAEAATSLGDAELLLSANGPARLHLDEVIVLALSLGDERLEWRARVSRADVAFFTGEVFDVRVGQDAIAVFERSGDMAGLAHAWNLVANVTGTAGDPHEAEAVARSVEYARAAGDKRLEGHALVALTQRLVFGPIHSSEALSEAERLLEQAAGDLKAAALVRACLSFLVAMRGDFEGARGMAAEARRALEELGLPANAAQVRALAAALIELVAAHPAVAETELRAGYAVLDELGEAYYLSSVAGTLAEVLALQDKDDEAEHYAAIGSEKSSDEDYDAQIRWRRAKALVLIHRGDLAEAEALARCAGHRRRDRRHQHAGRLLRPSGRRARGRRSPGGGEDGPRAGARALRAEGQPRRCRKGPPVASQHRGEPAGRSLTRAVSPRTPARSLRRYGSSSWAGGALSKPLRREVPSLVGGSTGTWPVTSPSWSAAARLSAARFGADH